VTLGFLMMVAATLFAALQSQAEEVYVAVATNFSVVMERLQVGFETQTGHELILISGSTGKLYAQILAGAPFEILLAADSIRPERLVRAGLANEASRRTYALGRLVLWSEDSRLIHSDGRKALRGGNFRRLALANPDLAPYGAAALEVLRALDLDGAVADRLVMGENVGQTFALVATGNAELGFIAASQQHLATGGLKGSYWLIPESLHSPIRQDAVLLKAGEKNSAAHAFLDYLNSREASEVILDFGYATE
jgi:molybdate transport system substrate-binding protein